jgi:hypothetical protein
MVHVIVRGLCLLQKTVFCVVTCLILFVKPCTQRTKRHVSGRAWQRSKITLDVDLDTCAAVEALSLPLSSHLVACLCEVTNCTTLLTEAERGDNKRKTCH